MNARRRVVLALLPALAGTSLTAGGLAGPLATSALASGASTTEGTTPTSTGANQEATVETTGETSTTPTTTTSTTPAPVSTAPAAPATTTPEPAPASAEPQVPTVVLQRKQKSRPKAVPSPTVTTTTQTSEAEKAAKEKEAKEKAGPNNVAGSPQSVAQEGALAAVLASAQTSSEALEFYRIPLFLLPIYKAAAVQYGVPWQILAAINEIETNYGTDLSVSSAGAVGWMQFEPSTWLQYGVDALDAGYADPYNPVDAIFAAARYLRAAGAATDLRGAILAYNHSEEYADSVLLRAKLIATYPKLVVATLTGLVDGVLPVTGTKVSWVTPELPAPSASSATAGAESVTPPSAVSPAAAAAEAAAPSAVAASVDKHASKSKAVAQDFAHLTSPAKARVEAVQDGRVAQIGKSSKLGDFIVLRDVYGDLFTYARLGSIAKTYSTESDPSAPKSSPVVEAASSKAPVPKQSATAGSQLKSSLTAKPNAQVEAQANAGDAEVPSAGGEQVPAGMGRVRLFARPGNPDARAALAVQAQREANAQTSGRNIPLHVGSVVPKGAVLGTVNVPAGDHDGHLWFSVRPFGDNETIDPAPLLANWAELQTALHPQGAKATNALLGATASDVFLLSEAQLQRSVLADPGITLGACERQEIAAGSVDKRVLAVLSFLSRSGLRPTVSNLSCGLASAAAVRATADAIDIIAINGKPIAGNQGPNTITQLTIRSLLALPDEFTPGEITSLMRFPGEPRTHSKPAYWNRIHIAFSPAPKTQALNQADVASAAHSASTGSAAASPVVAETSPLTPEGWSKLITRVASLPTPAVSSKPSSAAIPDHPQG